MATDADFADLIVEQLEPLGGISVRKMFGEYGVWRDGKIVGLICDNQLFVKPTDAGRAFIEEAGELVLAPPYPGAKDSFLIAEGLEDADWLRELVRRTDAALPAPKPRKKRAGKKKKGKKTP